MLYVYLPHYYLGQCIYVCDMPHFTRVHGLYGVPIWMHQDTLPLVVYEYECVV